MLNVKAEAEAVFRWVCTVYGIEEADLLGRSREHPFNEARVVGYLLARRRGMSYPRVAKLFKRGDHTTVISGVKRAEKLLAKDASLVAMVSKFCAEREAYDADTLALVAAYRVETEWMARGDPPGQPPEQGVDNGGETLGVAGGLPSPPAPPLPDTTSQVLNSSPDSASLLSSDQRPDSKRARESKAKRGVRFVPKDWEPTEEHRKRARLLGVNFDEEVQNFREHEFKEPKTRFDLAFFRWLKNANKFNRPPGFLQHQQLRAEESAPRRPELRPMLPPRPVQEATPLEILAHVGQVLPKRPAPVQTPGRRMSAAELDRAVEEMQAGRSK
jgi:hypothetical protein